ncbi:hypothetical protein NUW58_g4608 [Xylaria curta]|uniref:Uncharacterized protein n=1 Tax=Xylaria curta TaxID=42375 RepID=A0ACC1P6J8_9PEZI|nr:hypothetical protein NUW58_g4608 [Xylaria curta]
MADQNGDKLARDAAAIICRLMPLLNPDLMTSAAIHLEIPYLGTININPSAHAHTTQHDAQPHAHATPSANINANTSTAPTTSTSTTAAKAASPSINLNPDEYVNFPSFRVLSHNPQPTTNWNTPPSELPTPAQGDQAAEASHLLSFPMEYSNDSNAYADFNGITPTMQFEWSQAQLAYPELAAEADEWTFQGFDTTYFESLFSSGAQGL